MRQKLRYYTAPDGTKYPLTEAEYPIRFLAYKSHARNSIPLDPERCVLARGILRDPNVLHVYIGSGKDAYVVFKGIGSNPPHAVHFTIRTRARRVIDEFDRDKKIKTQPIELSAPTPGRTLDHRRRLNNARKLEIRNGAPVAHRGPSSGPRVTRMGIKHRPRAPISETGDVGATN